MATVDRFLGKSDDGTPAPRKKLQMLAAVAGEGDLSTRAGVAHAIAMAKSRAAKMAAYRGVFPLPPGTPQHVLAVLSPEDIGIVTFALERVVALRGNHAFNGALATPDLSMKGSAAPFADRTSPDDAACLSYHVTFTRRAFHHEITASACRGTTGWKFLPSKP